MKKRRMNWAAALLALSLALTACGADGKKPELADPAFVAAPNYIAEDLSLPEDTGELFGSCTDGESLWYLMAGEGEASARLYRADLADGRVEELPDYRSPEAPEGAQIRRYGPVLAPDGTLWVYEEWWIPHYDLPEGFDPETDLKGPYFTGQDEFLHLNQLDPRTGKEKRLADLSEAARALDLADTFGAIDFTVDKDGNLYLAGPGGVAVLDGGGKHLFTLETDIPDTGMSGGAGGRLVLLPDGRAAVLTVQPGAREVRTIDPAARDWGKDAYPVPDGVGAVFGGREPCQFYFVQDNVLYGAVAGETIPQRLLPLENTGLEGYEGMSCFALLEEGRLAMLTRRVPEGGRWDEAQVRLALLSPTNQLPEDGKIRVVYGTIGDDPYVRSRIKAFNRKSADYYIEYRSYTDGAVWNSREERLAVWDAARLRLNAEIAAGRAPDIMSDALPLDLYAQAGYLEDLWPWIDGDPDISREGLMEHVLDCASIDGRLYSVGSSFTIRTAVASRAAAGTRTGWTLEEMTDACGGAVPKICSWGGWFLYEMNADDTLYQLLSGNLGRYVDWETGRCRFDSGDFKDLLRLCTGAGTGETLYDPVTLPLWENPPVLCETTLRSVQDLVLWDTVFGGPESVLPAEDYEAALWDAGVLYTFVSEHNGQECTSYRNARFLGQMEALMEGGMGRRVAAGAVSGLPDGKVYAAFAGLPSADGPGSSFTLEDRMAISASSQPQVKEGAWAFVRSLLLPGGYLQKESFEGVESVFGTGFPINRPDFEALLEPRWCRVDGDGEIIPDKDGQPIPAPAEWPFVLYGEPVVLAAYRMTPTQAQMDRFWDLYNAIDRMSGEDEELLDLIREQAGAYFAGDRSLAETAEQIQRRATLYVNEKR